MFEVLQQAMKEDGGYKVVNMAMIHAMLAEEEDSKANPEVLGVKDGLERAALSSPTSKEGELEKAILANEDGRKIVEHPLRVGPLMAHPSLTSADAVSMPPSVLIVGANLLLQGSNIAKNIMQKLLKDAPCALQDNAATAQSVVYDRGKQIMVA